MDKLNEVLEILDKFSSHKVVAKEIISAIIEDMKIKLKNTEDILKQFPSDISSYWYQVFLAKEIKELQEAMETLE